MQLAELTERIAEIEAMAGDPEIFHGEEDRLMMEWISQRCAPEELTEWERLWSNDCVRWYA